MSCERDQCISMLNAITDFGTQYGMIHNRILEDLKKFHSKEQRDDIAAAAYYTVVKTIGEHSENTTAAAKGAHDAFLAFLNEKVFDYARVSSEGPIPIPAEEPAQPQHNNVRLLNLDDAAAWTECGEALVPAANNAKQKAEDLYADYSNLKDRIGGSNLGAVIALGKSLKYLCDLQEAFVKLMQNAAQIFEGRAEYIKKLNP